MKLNVLQAMSVDEINEFDRHIRECNQALDELEFVRDDQKNGLALQVQVDELFYIALKTQNSFVKYKQELNQSYMD